MRSFILTSILCIVFSMSLAAQIAKPSRSQQLLELRTAELSAGNSTREIDAQLTRFGYRFPVKARLTTLSDKQVLDIPALWVGGKEAGMPLEGFPHVRSVTYVASTDRYTIEMSNDIPAAELNQLLINFGYDGYVIE